MVHKMFRGIRKMLIGITRIFIGITSYVDIKLLLICTRRGRQGTILTQFFLKNQKYNSKAYVLVSEHNLVKSSINVN